MEVTQRVVEQGRSQTEVMKGERKLARGEGWLFQAGGTECAEAQRYERAEGFPGGARG